MPQQQQQMNGNYSASSQMQNPGVHPSMEPELLRARRFMSEKIYEFFMRRQPQIHEIPQKTMLKIVKKLEEGLFKSASTKEEYVNLATLESRLHALIMRPPLINHNQQYSHVNSTSSVGTMIPTPGMPQSANSSLMATSSVDNSMVLQGDGYGMSTADSSGCKNLSAPATSIGLTTNNQNLNAVNVKSISETKSPLMTNQSNLHTAQQIKIKPSSVDHLEKMSFPSHSSFMGNLVQSHQHQQFQQQHLLQHQHQQNGRSPYTGKLLRKSNL